MDTKGLLTLRRWVFLTILVALMIALPLSTVSAALRSCRTDPIVFLSDGHKISISTEIGSEAANVVQIRQALHIPKGIYATKIIHTGGIFVNKEFVAVFDDQPSGKYYVETAVIMNTGTVEVSTTLRLTGGGVATISGYSDKLLVNRLDDPALFSNEMIITNGE